MADAAHQLHTPLTALRTNLELATSEADLSRQLGFLEAAQAQTGRLGSLVNNLLDLSRLEAASDQHQPAPVDLAELAHQVSELYAARAEQAGLSFRLEVPAEAVPVNADRQELRMVLENLLDNAIKFTPAGGELSLAVQTIPEYACLVVEDSGIGIPAEDQPRLFQRFHRASNAAAYPGSGLGLAIVKAIADRHQGTIRLESQPGRTCFTLVLPAPGLPRITSN